MVGKFCPLHRGHELLIGRAVAACDEVLVISYTKPEFDGCGRDVRDGWLAALFPRVRALVVDDASLRAICAARGIAPAVALPHNDAPEEEHRSFCGWLCLTVFGVTVDAVFTSEDYGDGFAASLTAYFRARAKGAGAVAHVCVDRARAAIAVSGTALRADVHARRAWLAPPVYASFVRRICILGGESSGKSSLAAALARRLRTVWAAEYGRELWDVRAAEGRQLGLPDMLYIGQAQCLREERLAQRAWRWLVCDTSPLTTYFYSLEMFGQADPALLMLAARPYDVYFVCAPDFPFVQDGTRRDDAFRLRQHAWYLDALERRGVRPTLLAGPLGARLEQAARLLSGSQDLGSGK